MCAHLIGKWVLLHTNHQNKPTYEHHQTFPVSDRVVRHARPVFFALRRMANCQHLWEVLILLGFFLSIFFMVCLASLTYAHMDTHVRLWAKLIAVLATPVVMYAVPA